MFPVTATPKKGNDKTILKIVIMNDTARAQA